MALEYQDGILIFFKTPEENINRARKVLTPLEKAVVTLKYKKCRFFTNTIKYVGQIDQLRWTNSSTTKARKCFAYNEFDKPIPGTRNRKDLRSFFRLCSALKGFVSDFTRIETLLNRNLQKA